MYNHNMSLKVGIIQLDSGNDKKINLDKCKAFIKKSKDLAVDVLAFPEMTVQRRKSNDDTLVPEEVTGESIKYFQEQAKNLRSH